MMHAIHSIGILFRHRTRILFSDRLFIPFLVLVPLVLSLISSSAMVQEMQTGIVVALSCESGDDEALALAAAIQAVPGFDVRQVAHGEAEALVAERKAEAALLIPKGFPDEQQKPMLLLSPYSQSGELVRERLTAELLEPVSRRLLQTWVSESLGRPVGDAEADAAWKKAREGGDRMVVRHVELEPVQSVTDHAGTGQEITLSPALSSGYGLMVLFLMFSCLYGSGWIAGERANGTLARLRSTGIGRFPLMAGNLLSVMAIGTLTAGLYLVVAVLALHAPMVPSVRTLGVMGAYLFAVSGLCMLIASLFPDKRQLQAAAPGIAILSGFAGGCLWNRAGLSLSMKRISLMTPQGWALQGLAGASVEAGRQLASQAVLVLFAIGLATSLLSMMMPERSASH